MMRLELYRNISISFLLRYLLQFPRSARIRVQIIPTQMILYQYATVQSESREMQSQMEKNIFSDFAALGGAGTPKIGGRQRLPPSAHVREI